MQVDKESMSFEDKIKKGFELTYLKMLKFKIQKNSPVIISKNGKIIKADPKKILKELSESK